ncbi:MAG: ferritin family protein [Rubrivivax sp.]|nr:ferritin family protein [Rubrivivax sp.]
MNAPQSLDELMAQALAMEREAVARYTELADMMEVHNNTEVAALFRKMAEVEGHHVAQILADMGWAEDTPAPRAAGAWATPEGPETVPLDEMHYLMHPWHALRLALAAEQRAADFFDALARTTTLDTIRRAAEEMRAEELAHVALVRDWLAKVPRPGPDWAVDPDPARHAD